MKNRVAQDTFQPFILARINDSELHLGSGQRIKYFELEEIDDGDDKITLKIADEYGNLIDNPLIEIRNRIKVQWGYPGRMSEERAGIMLEPEYEFSDRMIEICISANDEGSRLHGRADQRVWNKMSHSAIALEIAKKHGLKPNIKDTKKIVETEPQGNRSDYAFLTYLASQNSYDFYIEKDVLHFHPKDKNKSPVMTINRKGMNERFFISFRPAIKAQQEKGEGTETTAIGYDPMGREPVVHKANADTKREAALGKKTLMINLGDGDTKYKKTESGHIQPTPQACGDEVSSEAESIRRKAEDNQVCAELVLVGLPWLTAKNIIMLRGVGKKFSGRYYIKGIRHIIDSGGYRSVLSLNRDAAIEKTGKEQTESQAQPKDGDFKKKKDIILIDLDSGKEVKK